MRYYAFVDRPDHLPLIRKLSDGADGLTVVNVDPQDGVDMAEVEALGVSTNDRVVISAAALEGFSEVIARLSSMPDPPSILVLAENAGENKSLEGSNVSVVDLMDHASHRLNREWRMIETRRKAHALVDSLKDAGQIAIVLQDDPDPDAIACGLAVQALLGRNRATAPMVTFGSVTRNENVAMVKMLKTVVLTVTSADLKAFDRIVMVDVQPPYFDNDQIPRVDAVIDHHPYPVEYDATFKDVNTMYGATSTMMYEYLTASGERITKRLATALLYGVMSDTMRLERGATRRDFEAFTALWPMANKDMLSDMARPRLKNGELKYFTRAIRNRHLSGDFLFIWLGRVDKEDIIPRLADFSLQMGESSFSVTCGVVRNEVVISLRSLDPERNAGEVARSLFGRWGGAGGHHAMAKAVFPLAAFKRAFALTKMKEVSGKTLAILKEELL
ncbi:MAG: DHH family phosphoesterase [Nitrospinae bacterium]|nr:DHH family phosphoesterase [Nitrospinota bacterium]